MPELPIDLGKPMGGPISLPEPSTASPKKEKYYPCLFLDWDNEYDLPESGIMEVRFVKKSETTRTRDGETSQSVELEIRAIIDVESEAKEKKESGGDALDKYKEELD
jgi:hypothetical protein